MTKVIDVAVSSGMVELIPINGEEHPVFMVIFQLQISYETVVEPESQQFLNVKTFVEGLPVDAPYCDIEQKAAQQLAPALRAVADLVEEKVK